jgi:cellulose synthase operon protein C
MKTRAFAFTITLCATAAVAQEPTRAPTVKESARADALAAEEAEKAKQLRDNRAPEAVKEVEREKVEVVEKPTLDYEDYRRQTELKVASKRKELIGYLDDILKQKPAEEERPELLFQKGELFLEEAQFHFFEANRVDDEIAAALGAGDDKKMDEANARKEASFQQSKKWGEEAIRIFEEIDKKYPKFPRIADVLYMMGQAYWDRGDLKDGLKVYRKLIKDHPKSQYISDAWLAFGEYYFQVGPDEDRDVQKALDSYIEAAKVQDSQVFGYATYKQGWCYYNLSRFDKSADKFKEVVLYSQINSQILGNRRIGLAKEARKDYVLAYAQQEGKAARAPADFRTIADGQEHRDMLERLGDIYYGDGKDRDAIIVYQQLMKDDPANTKNPLYQGKVVKLASRIGNKKQVVGQAQVLVNEYKRVRTVLGNTKNEDPKREAISEDLKDADGVSDNTLRFLATTWHNEAKKTLDPQTFEYSYELYKDYLDLFPERKEAYEIRFFMAELLFHLERYELAGEQYVKVYAQDKKGKWAEASAEEAVRSYDEVNRDYDRNNKAATPAPVGLKERPLPDVKKKYVAACNEYVNGFPKGKNAIEARYKVARTLYDFNYFKESTPRFTELIDLAPEHPRAEQAANLVMDTYNIQENWLELNTAARAFSKKSALMKNKDFKDLLEKILEESTFKLISDFQKKREWQEAATRYVAFAQEFPKSALADKALANAAAMFTFAGQLERSIKVRQQLVSQYPESPLVPDQIYAIATGYEQVVLYRDAAEWLEKFSSTYPKDARAADALYNASIYRHGTNDTKKAVDDRVLYMKSYPDAKDTEEVAYSIPVAWDEAGKWKEAATAYSDFADKWNRKNPAKALNAQYKSYRLLEKHKAGKTEVEKSLRTLAAMAGAYKRSAKPTDEVGDPLALIAFLDADAVLEKYKSLKIARADNADEFKKTLKQKIDARSAVKDAYTSVVELKSPEWAVASLFRVGEASANLVKVLNELQAPRAFTEEQAQLFKDKIGEQTFPIEEEAAQTMELCLQKSAAYAVFNEWTKRCLTYLEEAKSAQYPKIGVEQRTPLLFGSKVSEQGVGVVIEIPKTGEMAKPKAGTEPPPVEKASPKTAEFSESDLRGGT